LTVPVFLLTGLSSARKNALTRERLKFQAVFSTLFAFGALLLTWVILGDGSPLAHYAAEQGFADPWQMTVLLPFVFSAVLSRNPHSPPLTLLIMGLFLQWWIVGYLVSMLAAVARARGREK
jgi:hypothetical protein